MYMYICILICIYIHTYICMRTVKEACGSETMVGRGNGVARWIERQIDGWMDRKKDR